MVKCKSDREIKIMRDAGKIVGQTLALMESLIKPGVTTLFLNQEAEKFIISQNGIPIFKGYHGFPASICASINEEIVHGVPSHRVLEEGDIISIDVGVKYQGYIGDAARTFPVGKISPAVTSLLKTCEECLSLGIQAACLNNKLSNIAKAVQTHAESHGYSVVREYSGHGVGMELHEEPQVPNYVDSSWIGYDITLKSGYCLAIEPMINLGTYKTKSVRRQNWDVVLTKDNKWSAHFEHSIAITDNGPLILTLP
jgi:methionyl aminopeptidase